MNKLLFSLKPNNTHYGILALAHHLGDKVSVEFVQNQTKDVILNGTENASCSIMRYLGAFSKLYGDHPTTLAQIDYWIDFAHDSLNLTDYKKLSVSFDLLNHELTLKSFLVGYSVTLADYAVWGALRGNAAFNSQLKSGKYQGVHLARWYNFMGETEPVLKGLKALEVARDGAKDRRDQGNLEIPLPDAIMGKVVTRFPPEPSGYLHIGHAKAAMLNDYFAKSYNGKLIVRFDDTNPSKEKAEFEDSIKEDLLLLGIKGDVITHTSDHFDHLYAEALRLIKLGKAYVDDTDQDTMRAERFDGIESKNRNQSMEETLKKFDEMKAGTEYGLKCCLRARIDMHDNNKTMRDPVIYRCNLTHHHVTGDKWKVYPTYDFACPIVDSLEGVTHALRTIEYRDRNAQYAWFIKALDLRWVHVWDYSRLNFIYTLLSKRKLTWFVDEKLVTGWDDPRFPTVRGIRRRGMTIEALRAYILSQGASQKEIMLEWDKVWSTNKRVIDPIAPRFTGLASADLVHVKIIGDFEAYTKEIPKHKKNPDVGNKTAVFSSRILLEQEDAKAMEVDEEVTLMDWGNAIVKKIETVDGKVKSIDIVLHLEGDFKKTKKKLTWLSENTPTHSSVPMTLLDYDYLITKKKLEEEDDVKDFVTQVTEFKVAALGDCNLKSVKKGDIIQLERKGYYICDRAFDPAHPDAGLDVILIPDGRVASLASKANEEAKPVAKKEKETKGKDVESKVNMYQMEAFYATLNTPSANSISKMYEMESFYPEDKQAAPAAVAGGRPAKVKPQKETTEVKTERRPKESKESKDKVVESSIISKLDIVVGKILNVKRHPDADSLYIEQIDIGEDTPREVVSGLVKFMNMEDMVNKDILVLKNLKPVAMRGVKSFAMVLCASDASHEKVEFLIPPAGSKPGDRVFFKGHEGEPEAQLNPKKKVWETVQPDFETTDDLVAVWKGVPFETSKGVIKVASLKKASIK